ncbi:MAG: ABC transporter permease [Thermoleophilaceae bacterium]|nr:ABC transporter permease [Thermoleophilaceae bacterium]
MSGARLAAHQFRYEQKIFWRNVPAVFFSLVLPLLFLLIFATIFGGQTDSQRKITLDAYYVPGIVSLGVISATLLNIAMSLSIQREEGILKRLRSTPLPTSVFVLGRAVGAVVNAYLIAAVIMLAGLLLYGVELSPERLLGAALVVSVAAAAFCCLGFALTILIPNGDAAPAVTNAIVLPLYFISGVFFPVDDAPQWLNTVANIFPIKHFVNAMLDVYSNTGSGLGIDSIDLAIIAIWGLVGLLLAVRYFRWTPSR